MEDWKVFGSYVKQQKKALTGLFAKVWKKQELQSNGASLQKLFDKMIKRNRGSDGKPDK